MMSFAATRWLWHGVSSAGAFQMCWRQASVLPLLSCRAFASSPLPSKDSIKPLKQWTFVVSPFSKIKCNLRCNISIRPLDPHAFPEADRAFITVHGTNADQGLKLDNFLVHYDDQSKELHIVAEEVNSNVSVELTTPIKSDLHVKTQGTGSVKIQKMECDLCRVQTERGHCVLQSLRSHRVLVESTGGNITGVGTIHGNVAISTSGDSSIDIKKIQGTTMKVSTENGPLKVKAVYAESTSLSSSAGQIQLGHVHGEATVRSETGDINVDSSSGALKVATTGGSIDAYVGQSGTADLVSQHGSVSVRVPAAARAGVHLCGASVEISPELPLQAERHSADGKTTITALLNGGSDKDCWIKAHAERGAVSLRPQSWFESLKLGN